MNKARALSYKKGLHPVEAIIKTAKAEGIGDEPQADCFVAIRRGLERCTGSRHATLRQYLLDEGEEALDHVFIEALDYMQERWNRKD